MKKGFILTITTLYYVALFILFLSLIVFLSFKTAHFSSVNIENQVNNSKFVNGDASINPITSEYWCPNYMSNYDANIDLESQTPINYKKYCVIYNGKRIV